MKDEQIITNLPLGSQDGIVITEAVAEKDFDKWLCVIKPPKRVIDGAERVQKVDIIERIMDGHVVINEDGTLLLKLICPLTAGRSLDSMVFRTRFSTHEIRKAVVRVPDGDSYGMLMAHASVLTGQDMPTISALDKSDFNIISAIVSYFL